jgi:hypothetical protein
MSEVSRIVDAVAAAPLGQIIAAVGEGVAEAQRALDAQALESLLALYADGAETDRGTRLLREIGWRPTFYALPETECEVRVALSVSGGHEAGTAKAASRMPAPARLYATPVDGTYSNRFGFDGTVSATVRFRIVPVPPPPGAELLARLPDTTTEPTNPGGNDGGS